MKTPALDQLPLFVTPQRGGKRSGAGRKSTGGTTTVRVPNACLKSVTQIIEEYKAGTLKTVTEIKDEPIDDLLPAERETGKFYDKYINPKNPDESWSGRGRMPMWVMQYTNNRNNIPRELLNQNPSIPFKRVINNELA